MKAITFDTLRFARRIEESGFTPESSRNFTEAVSDALVEFSENNRLATKNDLVDLREFLKGFIVKSVGTSVLILGGLQTLFHFVR